MTTPTGRNSRDPGARSTDEDGEAAGALVGKNQTGPNYRNHNESVSRGTLLPGKHQGTCVHSLSKRTHFLKRPQVLDICTKHTPHRFTICFFFFAKNYTQCGSRAHVHPKRSVDPDN